MKTPTFEEAKNRRQRVRAAGMNPNHWYPVGYDADIAPGDIVEVKFWGKSLALYRGHDRELRCLEDRCAHRQLPLSIGEVQGCRAVCQYHGWKFNGDGKLVDVSHELFGKKLPRVCVPNYPVKERYGLIWIFPGDPKRADTTPMPHIPELEGGDPWACVPVDFTWQAHHSMIMDNICDFTHEFLHRRTKPFENPHLRSIDVSGDCITVDYDATVGAGPIYRHLINRKSVDTGRIRLGYEYPHQWSNTDDWIHHWCFMLPIDERTTRVFFLFYYKAFQIPGLGLEIPKRYMNWILKVANRIVMKPILDEDKIALEAEQRAYEKYYDAPIAELNPVIDEFQKLTIRRWEEYLAERDSQPAARRLPLRAAV
jgi:hypothetical protein